METHDDLENAGIFPRFVPQQVIYIVTSMGGIETVWDDPDDALKAFSELVNPGNIIVRPLNSKSETESTQSARQKFYARSADKFIKGAEKC